MIGRALFALIVLAAPAVAQQARDNVILSDEYGRPMVIGSPAEATAGLTPMSATGEQIARDFKDLCITDDFHVDEAASLLPWHLQEADVVFPATKKTPQISVTQWRGPSARWSLWAGPAGDAALKGQPVTIRDRGVAITSGYGSYKAAGRQCNIDLSLSGFADSQGLADALSAIIGQPPVKLAVKPGFADGYWQTTTGDVTRRIAFAVVDLKKPTQPLHLTVQLLSPKAAK